MEAHITMKFREWAIKTINDNTIPYRSRLELILTELAVNVASYNESLAEECWNRMCEQGPVINSLNWKYQLIRHYAKMIERDGILVHIPFNDPRIGAAHYIAFVSKAIFKETMKHGEVAGKQLLNDCANQLKEMLPMFDNPEFVEEFRKRIEHIPNISSN